MKLVHLNRTQLKSIKKIRLQNKKIQYKKIFSINLVIDQYFLTQHLKKTNHYNLL